MSDSAKGTIAGFVFQFQRALYLLTSLENNLHSVSVEKIDDIAMHAEDGSILIAEQDKHSILESGSTFENTSYALWRTFQLWIQKMQNGKITEKTKLICSTNKTISTKSLLKFIANNNFEEVKSFIDNIKTSQENKLQSYKVQNNKRGKHISQIINLMDFVLKNEKELKIIISKLEIQENTNLKGNIISKLHLNAYNEIQKDKIYDDLCGWVMNSCYQKWANNDSAEFSKEQFDVRYSLCINSSAFINAIFRAKKNIDISSINIDNFKDEIFVKQIDCLNTNDEFKKHYIGKAIEDFIKYEIEHTYVIKIGNLTKEDFLDFLKECKESWKNYYYGIINKKLEDYTKDEQNDLAIKIYTHIINDLKIKFNNNIEFNTENVYIKNGSFLKLSNIPEIGWHPRWKNLFQKKINGKNN